MRPLTDKQAMFCKEYLIDLNATQACVRAGYSARNPDKIGPELLGNTRVQAEINRLMSKRSKKIEITAQYVLTGIKEVAQRCAQKVPVMVGQGKDRCQMQAMTEDGEVVGVWQFDAANVLRAHELLGKHLKLFRDQLDLRVEHSGEVPEYKELDDMDYLKHVKNRLQQVANN